MGRDETIRGRHLAVVVAMCGLSAATVGLITNVAGLFFTPMAEEFGVLRGTASLTLTIANVCVAIGGLATRRLTKLMPLRLLLVVGAAVLAGSNLAVAAAPGMGAVYALSATKGLAGGVIGFVLITYVLNKWFAERLGLVTSLAMGFSGIAGTVLTPVVQLVVTSMGWRAGEVLVSALMVALCLPAILLVPSCDPAEAGLAPLGAKETARGDTGDTRGKPAEPIRVDRLLFAGVFLYAVLSAAISAMPQHFPGVAEEAGLGARLGAVMISACMLANTLGKVVMGWLTDRVGVGVSVLAYTALVGVATVALLLVRVPLAFVGAAFFFGLCYARATVGLSMLCRELFGARGFGVVYPVAALGCSISNAVFSSAVGFAFDLTGGYAVSLLAFFACLVLSALAMMGCYGWIGREGDR